MFTLSFEYLTFLACFGKVGDIFAHVPPMKMLSLRHEFPGWINCSWYHWINLDCISSGRTKVKILKIPFFYSYSWHIIILFLNN